MRRRTGGLPRFVGVQNIIPPGRSRRGGLTVGRREERRSSRHPAVADKWRWSSAGKTSPCTGENPATRRRRTSSPRRDRPDRVHGAVRERYGTAGAIFSALVTARRAEALELHEGMEVPVSLQAKAVHLILMEGS